MTRRNTRARTTAGNLLLPASLLLAASLLLSAYLPPAASLSASPAVSEPVGQSAHDSSEEDLAELAGRMRDEVEALRGCKFKHPVDVGVYTEEEVRAFIEDSFDREEGRRKRSRVEAALKMVGLIPADGGLMDTSRRMLVSMSPPGTYNAETKELRIVKKPGLDSNSPAFQTILVHELTHALDDQHFDLQKMERETQPCVDAEIVIGSIVEGSAVTVQQRYMNKMILSGKADLAQSTQGMAAAMGDMQAVFDVPLYFATFFARFTCGVAFLQFGAEIPDSTEAASDSSKAEDRTPAGGAQRRTLPPLKCVAEAMRKAATDTPRSSEQILHPEKYWRDESRDEPVVVRDDDVERFLAGEGLRVTHKDTFGELRTAVLTSPEGKRISPADMPLGPDSWTNRGAAGWGGDRFFLLAEGAAGDSLAWNADRLYGVWFTMWDTNEDREEFIADYETHRPSLPGRALILGDRCAVFLFNLEGSKQEALEEILRTSPPGFTQAGKPWVLANASHR